MTGKRKLVDVRELPITKQLEQEQAFEDDFLEQVRGKISDQIGYHLTRPLVINYLRARPLLTGKLLQLAATKGAVHAHLQLSNPATEHRYKGGGYMSMSVDEDDRSIHERCDTVAVSVLRTVMELNTPDFKGYAEGMLVVTRERENPETTAGKFVIVPNLLIYEEVC